jgi:hypothetical protein
MTAMGIDPVTLLFVAQYLNQLCHQQLAPRTKNFKLFKIN